MPIPNHRVVSASFPAALLATALLLAAPAAEPAHAAQAGSGHLATVLAQMDAASAKFQSAQAGSGHLATVLAQMDAASAKFQSAQADLKQEIFTKVVQATDTQTGEIYFLRKGSSVQMGMRLLPQDAKPGDAPAQVVEFKDGVLRVLNTGENQVDEFSASGKNQGLAQTLMTLGFGGSGTDLQKSWNIIDQGSESMSDGAHTVQVEKLDLVSKDSGIRNNFPHITIWIDPTRDVSLKQVLFEASGGVPSGDTRTAYYTNIRMNQHIDTAPFAINCKGHCTVSQH